jgi:hypothetical protein
MRRLLFYDGATWPNGIVLIIMYATTYLPQQAVVRVLGFRA